jgi:hypothetical protein
MPSPFPGMDPYLEGTEWESLHHLLVTFTIDQLQPQLRRRGYQAKPGQRVWVTYYQRRVQPDVAIVKARRRRPKRGNGAVAVAEPDEPIRIERMEVEVREPFVEIYSKPRHKLVTGIEFISPTNKMDRKGRSLYQKKQKETRQAGVNLVEVDLIRRGPRVVDVPEAMLPDLPRFDYLVNLVRRGSEDYELYPIRLRDRLPRIRIPLLKNDDDAVVDLQLVFQRSYDLGGYDEDVIDYTVEPTTPLEADDAAWARQLLKKKGLRK